MFLWVGCDLVSRGLRYHWGVGIRVPAQKSIIQGVFWDQFFYVV